MRFNLGKLGIDITWNSWQNKTDDFIRANLNVSAIREVRSATGMSLKDAKAFVDRRREEIGIKPPWEEPCQS